MASTTPHSPPQITIPWVKSDSTHAYTYVHAHVAASKTLYSTSKPLAYLAEASFPKNLEKVEVTEIHPLCKTWGEYHVVDGGRTDWSRHRGRLRGSV